MSGLPIGNFRLKILFLVYIFLPVVSYAQLSDFTLQVTPTPETCPGNGSLTFAVSNTTAGASIVYKVYHLPDVTTPIATLSGNTVNGLTAGTYRVIATQTLGTLSNSQSQDAIITSSVVPLTYQLVGQNVICGTDGNIIVQVTQGSAVSYEIFSGPVIVPLQSSNVLAGLVAGTYQVRVFDSCGEGVVQTFTLGTSTAGMNVNVNAPVAIDCDTIRIGLTLNAGGPVVAYPITVQVTVNPPTGPPLVFNQTIAGATSQVLFSQEVPLYPNQNYTYSYIITDHCGNVYNGIGTISASAVVPTASLTNQNCQTSGVVINHVTGLVLTNAPPAYPNALPYDYTGSITDNNSILITSLPLGTYIFSATDVCGNVSTLTVIVVPPTSQSPAPSIKEGCDIGLGSFGMFGNFLSVVVTAAPAGFPHPLPYDVSMNIDSSHNNSFAMNGMPPGVYSVHTTDACGAEYDVPFTIQGYQDQTDITVTENCASFNLGLYHTSNNAGTLWLQKYNAATGQWMNPANGTPYMEGTQLNASNAVSLTNNSVTLNLAFTGNFRIIKMFTSFDNGVFALLFCYRVVKEFEFTGTPKINNLYSFNCNNSTFDVIVDAVGLPPLIYRITTKNSLPFTVENGNSNVFLGLEPAVYNFQVEDACGNILNRPYTIPTPFVFSITPSGLCAGQSGSLSVPYFPFLHYEWWKDSDTSVILSTNGTLTFTPFTQPNDFGVYHVRITNPATPSSCINYLLDYDISQSLNNPEAGQGSTVSYCGTQGDINLFALLSGTYNANGIWQEISSSGNLTGNIWDSAVPSGAYQFKYTVSGLCGTSDEAIVNINIGTVPETPVASVEQLPCETQDLHLLSTTVDDVIYEWTGPNGFTSDEQNPIIANVSTANSGIYTVRVVSAVGDCPSGTASVEVGINAIPKFLLESACNDNIFTVMAVPVNNAFDPAEVTYSWTGPESFTSSINPIVLTGLPAGNYALTVDAAGGCSFTANIDIATTNCTIPQGVSPNDDGDNDSFDLSGFDVEHLKIFNRYGMMVYERDNYIDQWNGQDYLGHTLPSATYFYLVRLAS
ncbi:MAG TPA: gliding motility-associated C-terminal domain-containing protein, partial [Flavobacterium sp.]|nr:gliding motility-associated C-terminal domain-containing protein [Flavobacterium sp.]